MNYVILAFRGGEYELIAFFPELPDLSLFSAESYPNAGRFGYKKNLVIVF